MFIDVNLSIKLFVLLLLIIFCTTITDSSSAEPFHLNLYLNRLKNLTEILATLKSKINEENSSKFNISRNDVLDGARRAVQRKSFQPTYRMSVKFTDDIGVAEGAVDAGGPKRELLRLLVPQIQKLPIFEGPFNSRSLAFRQTGISYSQQLSY